MPRSYSPGFNCFTDMAHQQQLQQQLQQQRMFYPSSVVAMTRHHPPQLNHSKMPQGIVGPHHHHINNQQQPPHKMLRGGGGGGCSGDEAVLPKFPPQTFEIPDIQDSNSVFGGMGGGGGDLACPAYDQLGPFTNFMPLERQSFSFSASTAPDVVQCRLPPTSTTPAWQQGVSSAGSTNSSPLSQNDEVVSFEGPPTLHVPTQVSWIIFRSCLITMML